jgi:hypothetical protein
MKTSTTAYFRRIRLRALAWLLGIALASVATLALSSISWVPIFFGAVAAAAVSLSKTAHRLNKPTCLGCGADISQQPVGTYGAICAECGAVNQPKPANEA